MKKANKMETEVHPNNHSLLRIDLVKGQEIYEVKPDRVEYQALGLIQLRLYAEAGKENGYIIGKTKLNIPPVIIENRAHEVVSITVRQEGPLILYNISRKLKEQKKKSTQVNNNYLPAIEAAGIGAAVILLSMIMNRRTGGIGGKDAYRYCYDY